MPLFYFLATTYMVILLDLTGALLNIICVRATPPRTIEGQKTRSERERERKHISTKERRKGVQRVEKREEDHRHSVDTVNQNRIVLGALPNPKCA